MTETARRATRRNNPLSTAVITRCAIQILDERGADALTVRALAAHLETGAGAIYHHIGAKDALLAAAATELVTEALAESAWDIRALLVGVVDLMDAHPWLGEQMSRAPWQPAVMRILEAIGERLTTMDVPEHRRFDVATALVQFVLGAAGQYVASAHTPAGVGRRALLQEVADDWTDDPAAFPFLRAIAPQLAQHDDRQQFQAGVDLILAGAAQAVA